MRRRQGNPTADRRQRCRRLRRLRFALLALTGLLLVGSVLPVPAAVPPTGPTGTLGATTLGHVVGYGTLAVVGVRYAQETGRERFAAVLAVVLAASLLGVGIEGIQATLPWRTASATDAAINAVSAGVGAGLAVAMRFYPSRE